LSQNLTTLTEALGYLFLMQGDSSLLNKLFFNYSKSLIFGIEFGIFPKSVADIAMEWVVANQLISRKLGIDEDSVLTDLLWIDITLDYDYSTLNWPEVLKINAKIPGRLDILLEKAINQAERKRNILEKAQCLQRLFRITKDKDHACRAYLEAVELFNQLGRSDLISKLKNTWASRYKGNYPQQPLSSLQKN